MSRAEDSARLHQRVTAESAKMLNLDVEHLTDAERVRVSMLSSVRLFDDRLQARLLAGQDVSSSDLQFVRNEMSRILGLPQEAAPVEGLGHPDSLQRLKDLIMARVRTERVRGKRAHRRAGSRERRAAARLACQSAGATCITAAARDIAAGARAAENIAVATDITAAAAAGTS